MSSTIAAGLVSGPVAGAKPARLENEEVEPTAIHKRLRGQRGYLAAKRAADIAIIVFAGPALLIVLGVAVLAVLLLMGRPIFFIQERVGYQGRVFKMLKLRTMTGDREQRDHATLLGDARVTPLGRILRLTHFDELPQLWNILTGDMTLIGPRPEQVHLVERYRNVIPNFELRHAVRPGLTGWAQVWFGYAADVEDTRHKTAYDLFYVANCGLWLDLRIVWRTLAVYLNPRYAR